jgi:hypothetical protein
LTDFHEPLHEAGSPYFTPFYFPPMAQQPPLGLGLLFIEASRSRSDTPHSVGLIWTIDKPDAEIYTLQHTQKTDIHARGVIRTRSPGKRAATDRAATEIRLG